MHQLDRTNKVTRLFRMKNSQRSSKELESLKIQESFELKKEMVRNASKIIAALAVLVLACLVGAALLCGKVSLGELAVPGGVLGCFGIGKFVRSIIELKRAP